jgi:hypothetical protein
MERSTFMVDRRGLASLKRETPPKVGGAESDPSQAIIA